MSRRLRTPPPGAAETVLSMSPRVLPPAPVGEVLQPEVTVFTEQVPPPVQSVGTAQGAPGFVPPLQVPTVIGVVSQTPSAVSATLLTLVRARPAEPRPSHRLPAPTP